MSVHIGSIIKELVKARNIKIDDFANEINCTRRNVYKIFAKPSIDTELLRDISKALNQNLFFNYISEKEIANHKNDNAKNEDIMGAIANLTKAVERIESKDKRVNRKKES